MRARLKEQWTELELAALQDLLWSCPHRIRGPAPPGMRALLPSCGRAARLRQGTVVMLQIKLKGGCYSTGRECQGYIGSGCVACGRIIRISEAVAAPSAATDGAQPGENPSGGGTPMSVGPLSTLLALLRRARCALRGGHRFRIAGWNGPLSGQRIIWRCACGEASASSRRGFFPDALRPNRWKRR